MATSRYFQGFAEGAPGDLCIPAEERPTQRNPDILPFDGLSGRRFEILCYRIKKAQHPQGEVSLMQGAGDSGRDVVVFSGGQLREVVQCKNLKDRLTKKELLIELSKLALYHCREPGVLGPNTTYEVWCPPGLSATAVEVINTWPRKWTETEVASTIKRLLLLPAFSKLVWTRIKVTLFREFPKLISPRKLEAIDLTGLVRERREIFDDFFLVYKVIAETDVRRVMNEVGWRQVTDADLKHLIDRVESFPPEERLRLVSSYVLGMKPEFVAEMTGDELKTFVTNTMAGVASNLAIIMDAGKRKAFKILSAHVPSLVERHPAFLYAMTQLVVVWVATRCPLLPRSLGKKHSDWHAEPIDEQFKALLEHIWEKRVLQTEPGLHADHALPLDLIRREFTSREAFERRLWESFRKNRPFVSAVFKDLDAIIPHQVLVVSDTLSVFDSDGALVQSFKSTMEALEAASQQSEPRRAAK